MIRNWLRRLAGWLDRLAGPPPEPKQPQQWEPRKEYAKVIEQPVHGERERALRLVEEQCRELDLPSLPDERKLYEIRRLARQAAQQVKTTMGVRRLPRHQPYWREPPALTDPELREQLRRELDLYFKGDT
jgi:hypothetical protein